MNRGAEATVAVQSSDIQLVSGREAVIAIRLPSTAFLTAIELF